MNTNEPELKSFVAFWNKRNEEIEKRKKDLPYAEQLVFEISQIKVKIK